MYRKVPVATACISPSTSVFTAISEWDTSTPTPENNDSQSSHSNSQSSHIYSQSSHSNSQSSHSKLFDDQPIDILKSTNCLGINLPNSVCIIMFSN